MKLEAFKVQMYRPILDSGWVDVDDITVIVGKNESGKTALLKALHKFNPFNPNERYSLDRDWPRGYRTERSQGRIVATARFNFEVAECEELKRVTATDLQTTGVEIGRTYGGDYTYALLPDDDVLRRIASDRVATLFKKLEVSDGASVLLKDSLDKIEAHVFGTVEASDWVSISEHLNDYVSWIQNAIQTEHAQDETDAANLKAMFDEIDDAADTSIQRGALEESILGWVPRFIYMDDHQPFRGTAYLDQLYERKNSERLTEEDNTFIMLLEMAGLNLEEEFQRASAEDKEQRMLDMDDASSTLTSLLADHWSQRKYKVVFHADGYHVIAFVSDEFQPSLVPLEDRSKGFQWFFSFDTTFLHDTQGTFRNAVILLDEPGLHLHASAQRDLLTRMKAYAEGNQLIYTTHMPFMIDMERLDNIRACLESIEKGTTVSSDIYAADEHALFPLQAALGLSMSQSLFIGPYNLVVEGVTDFWLISAMATIFQANELESLDDRIVITPAGGASRAAYVATMLHGQNLNVVILLDSDTAGESAAQQLIKDWIIKDRHVLLLGNILGHSRRTELEDIIPEEFYLQFINAEYSREFKGNDITQAEIEANKHPQIVERVDAAFKARGMFVNSEGKAFNKGRVAKRMLTELPKISFEDLPEKMVCNFTKLFEGINRSMPGL